MKTIFKITAIAAGMTVAMGAAHAASVTDAGSKHNLSSTGTAAQYTGGVEGSGVATGGTSGASTTTQVCVFCHTPHGASTSAKAPLWNKPLDSTGDAADGTSFSRYASTTLDATNAAVGSVSIACLSCHDGTQAMNAVINVPGSGTGTQTLNDTEKMFERDTAGAEIATGTAYTTGIPNLGTDLSNDHPISMQYAGGGCSSTDTVCASQKDADFVTPAYTTINGDHIWWVDTGNSTTNGGNFNTGQAVQVAGSDVLGTAKREKTDMILYTRGVSSGNDGVAGATVDEPFVECASCHDPHQTVSRPVQFLRIDNSGSNVCLACHTK